MYCSSAHEHTLSLFGRAAKACFGLDGSGSRNRACGTATRHAQKTRAAIYIRNKNTPAFATYAVTARKSTYPRARCSPPRRHGAPRRAAVAPPRGWTSARASSVQFLLKSNLRAIAKMSPAQSSRNFQSEAFWGATRTTGYYARLVVEGRASRTRRPIGSSTYTFILRRANMQREYTIVPSAKCFI